MKNKLFIFSIFMVLLFGCTHHVKPAKLVESYPEKEKINLSVKLAIPDELKSATVKTHFPGDNWVTEFGDSLVQNSIQLMNSLFTRVEIPDIDVSNMIQESDIVLTPNLVSAADTHSAFIFNESIVTLALEWTALDDQGKTIWKDTITGEGKSPGGAGFGAKENVEKRFDTAIKNLFQNSYNAISESHIFRHLEKKNN